MKLEQSDFTAKYNNNGYWYEYSCSNDDCIVSKAYANWPFHQTEQERISFLEGLGILNTTGAFPYMKTREEALFILLLAIIDFNERNCEERKGSNFR